MRHQGPLHGAVHTDRQRQRGRGLWSGVDAAVPGLQQRHDEIDLRWLGTRRAAAAHGSRGAGEPLAGRPVTDENADLVEVEELAPVLEKQR